MNIKKTSLTMILFSFLFIFCPLVNAQAEIPAFKTYPQAQADVVWKISSGQEDTESEGVLYVNLPDKYIYVLEGTNSKYSKITGLNNITGFHSFNGQTEYDYYSISLFQLHRQMFGWLVSLANQTGFKLGEDTLIGLQVQLFQDNGSQHIYWLEKETNIPLRVIDSFGETILNLKQYKVEPYNSGGLSVVHLQIHDHVRDGLIILENIAGFWLPQHLSVLEGDYQITIDYENWQLLNEDFSLVDLEQLDKYLYFGYQAYQAQDLVGMIENYKQVLRIDPFNIQAYASLAYAYTELDNYLGTVESYQQWLMLEPQNPVALNNLAYTYLLAGNHIEEAISMAHQALQIESSPHNLDTLGYGYYLIGDYENAKYYLEQAINGFTGEGRLVILEHLFLVYQALDEFGNAWRTKQQIEILKMEMENERPLF